MRLDAASSLHAHNLFRETDWRHYSFKFKTDIIIDPTSFFLSSSSSFFVDPVRDGDILLLLFLLLCRSCLPVGSCSWWYSIDWGIACTYEIGCQRWAMPLVFIHIFWRQPDLLGSQWRGIFFDDISLNLPKYLVRWMFHGVLLRERSFVSHVCSLHRCYLCRRKVV